MLFLLLCTVLLLSQCNVFRQGQVDASMEGDWLEGLDTLEMVSAASILYDNQTQRFKAKFRRMEEKVWGQFTKFGFEGARVLFSRVQFRP